MKQRSVSVIIPVYNEATTILKLLDSLENQIFKKFQVIIVDNNSTDKTIEIVQNKKDDFSFPIKITKCKTQGISYARNKGARIANTKYLFFLDSDGYIPYNRIHKDMKILQKNSYIKATAGKMHYIHRNRFKEILYNSYVHFLYIFLLVIQTVFKKTIYLSGNNMLIEKQLFDKVGGFPHVVGEDMDLVKRINRELNGKERIKATKHPFYTSSRRMDKKGFLKTISDWFFNNLRKKSSKDYEVYR